MKRLLIFLTLLCLTVPQLFAREEIIFGINPWRIPKELQEIHQPIIERLEKALGMKVTFRVTKDYDTLMNYIRAGAVDMASLSPNLYVQTKKTIPNVHYLATVNKHDTNGNLTDHYYSIIFTHKDSDIRKLEDLRGRTFAFTDYKSTSGYIYPNMMLIKAGIDPKQDMKKVFMLKKHPKVLEAIMHNSVDAGASASDIFDLVLAKNGEILRILAKTDPIPFDAYITSPHVSEALSAQIRQALLGIKDVPPGINRPISFTLKDDSYYDPIREVNAFLKNH